MTKNLAQYVTTYYAGTRDDLARNWNTGEHTPHKIGQALYFGGFFTLGAAAIGTFMGHPETILFATLGLDSIIRGLREAQRVIPNEKYEEPGIIGTIREYWSVTNKSF